MTPATLYRTECYSGSGITDPGEVILFETLELSNTDIFETILENGLIQNEDLKKRIQSAIDYIDAINNYEIDNIHLTDEDQKFPSLINDILAEIKTTTGKTVNYVLWLASKDSVKLNYEGNVNEDNIYEYPTSDIILSDLGPDGILFGYENRPVNL